LSDFDNNSELGIIIKEVKQELKAMFLKRKDIIIKLGDAFEKFVPNGRRRLNHRRTTNCRS
jgi:hypothetical protein